MVVFHIEDGPECEDDGLDAIQRLNLNKYDLVLMVRFHYLFVAFEFMH